MLHSEDRWETDLLMVSTISHTGNENLEPSVKHYTLCTVPVVSVPMKMVVGHRPGPKGQQDTMGEDF